jgi:hypothetical protein
MTRFGIRGHGCSDGATQGATKDGSLAPPDFVAYGCTSRAANAAANGRIHGRIPSVCCRSEQGC